MKNTLLIAGLAGAAMLAGLGAGMFTTLDEAAKAMRGSVRHFSPHMDAGKRGARLAAWRKAVAQV